MSILIDTLKSSKARFGGKPLIINLLVHYQNKKEDPKPIEIASYAKTTSSRQVAINENTMDGNYKDYRLKRILLRGIRKYPSKGNNYYSINFERKATCFSSIFLGSNGVGKSSIYSALERISTETLNSAISRGYISKEAQADYLRNVDSNIDDSEIIIEFTHNYPRDYVIYRLNQPNSTPLSYPAFFCMEQDITILSQSLSSEYIAEQLGILDFYRLLINLESIKDAYDKFIDSYNEDKNKTEHLEFLGRLYNYLKKTGKTEVENISNFLFHIAHTQDDQFYENDETYNLLFAQLENLEKTLGDIESEGFSQDELKRNLNFNRESLTNLHPEGIDKSKFKEKYQILKQICGAVASELRPIVETILQPDLIDSELSLINSYKQELDFLQAKNIRMQRLSPLLGISNEQYYDFIELYNFLNSEYSKKINILISIANEVFPSLFRDFLSYDLAGIELQNIQGGKGIEISIRRKKQPIGLSNTQQADDTKIEPRKFLNTFRFKIFCLSLKISLAFCCSKLYNLNFPIVIDDVFDSSDFSNREKIRYFIKDIYKSHDHIFNGEMQLQLLFFTQDDVIGDSVYNGISDLLGQEEVKYSRIFDFNEAIEDDMHTENFPQKGEINVISIEDLIRFA